MIIIYFFVGLFIAIHCANEWDTKKWLIVVPFLYAWFGYLFLVIVNDWKFDYYSILIASMMFYLLGLISRKL